MKSSRSGSRSIRRLCSQSGKNWEEHPDTYPLFDTERFRRNVEAAYIRMWEIAERGEKPESFSAGF